MRQTDGQTDEFMARATKWPSELNAPLLNDA